MKLRRTLLHGLLCSAFVVCVVVCGAWGAEHPGRVVYVAPDLGTYLYAISLWDKDKQSPIFIGESRFLDIFLKLYPDAKVEKLPRKSVGRITTGLVYRTLYAAWGPETLDTTPKSVGRDELKRRLDSLGLVPQGIVITNVHDAELAGAVALAAGRHQIIGFATCDQKRSDKVNVWDNSAYERTKEKLRKEVLSQVEEWGYPYKGLGEGIDYITLALNMSHTYRYERPGTDKGYDPGYAITDAIGRLTPSGVIDVDVAEDPRKGQPSIYAYGGQLIEAAPQMAVYQAMASLFAETRKAFYYHGWNSIHGLEGVKGSQVLRTVVNTINRDRRSDPLATLDQWRRLTRPEHGYGFIHVAAAGGAYDWFDGKVADIPDGVPCVVYFAQSGSTANPAVTDTLAGRWLYNGAYVYYGAASEPYAHAFNAAQVVAQTLVAGGTFGEAFQRKDTLPRQFRRPWRICYIGDPMARPQFAPDPGEAEWSRTWRRAVALLRQAEYRDAVLLMEGVYDDVPPGRLDELWQDLLRGYELTFGISSFGLPNPKRYFTPELIDGWMLPADVAKYRPELGWQARLHLRLVKDAELSDLLASRLEVDSVPDALKERIRNEAAALDVSATRVKMWYVLGPLAWTDVTQVPRDFPPQMPVNVGATHQGADGEVKWGGALVDPETHMVTLEPAASGNGALYVLVTRVFVPGSKSHWARLAFAGTAGKADPAPVVWIGRTIAKRDDDDAYEVMLRPGENQITLLVPVPGRAAGAAGGAEPVTLQMSLTEPDGKRSRDFKFVDLIQQQRRSRSVPPGGQR